MKRAIVVAVGALALLLGGTLPGSAHQTHGNWGTAVDIEVGLPGTHPDFNLPSSMEGCPFVAKDGKTFFMASNRPNEGTAALDIWVSTRASVSDPWGAPTNAADLNTTSNDFCPTLAQDGHTFFFASNRPGHCEDTPNADIWTARFNEDGSFSGVRHLGCEVNSGADEHSPFPTNLQGTGPVLFYSSARSSGPANAPGDHDLYLSHQLASGVWGAGTLVPGDSVNTSVNDGQPNVSRDGLELYFYSNRPGTLGGNDLYVSTRTHPRADWGVPVNLGPEVNSAVAMESRPSLSWDMKTLYFGSTRTGSGDIYVTTRP